MKLLLKIQEHVQDVVAQIAQEPLSMTEKMLIATELEERFIAKLMLQVSEEEFEQLQAQTDEELEAFLFHRVPNYLTLLEEVATEFLVDYLG